MASLKKHGYEIGTLEFTTYRKRYMSNGSILKNEGYGWKLYRKVKDGITPEQQFANAKERQEAVLAARPAFRTYRKALHDLAPLSLRWKLEAAVSHMPNDPDGVWSEACDGYGQNVHASPEEIRDLCIAYGAAVLERKAASAKSDLAEMIERAEHDQAQRDAASY